MTLLTLSDAWKVAYPTATIGLLAMDNLTNPTRHLALDERKEALERDLRGRFGQSDAASLRLLDPIAAYVAYYKRYQKSYHVLQQLVSALKGKAIPRQAALVEAMFMAELQNLLLTAGHDLDALTLPLFLDAATGAEHYTLLNGSDYCCKPADMMMADADGPICTILGGQDDRTCIRPTTRRALFVVYGVPGVTEPAVRRHLAEIETNVRLFSPDATVIKRLTVTATG